MPRATRSTKLIEITPISAEAEAPKKARGRPRKRKNSTDTIESTTTTTTTSSSSSTPSKISRSGSISPLSDRLATQLNVTASAPKTSKFQSARRALADNSSYRLPGRESQFEELTAFLNTHIDTKSSGSLYINGPPGMSTSLKPDAL
jgi:hypothetical protein